MHKIQEAGALSIDHNIICVGVRILQECVEGNQSALIGEGSC